MNDDEIEIDTFEQFTEEPTPEQKANYEKLKMLLTSKPYNFKWVHNLEDGWNGKEDVTVAIRETPPSVCEQTLKVVLSHYFILTLPYPFLNIFKSYRGIIKLDETIEDRYFFTTKLHEMDVNVPIHRAFQGIDGKPKYSWHYLLLNFYLTLEGTVLDKWIRLLEHTKHYWITRSLWGAKQEEELTQLKLSSPTHKMSFSDWAHAI